MSSSSKNLSMPFFFFLSILASHQCLPIPPVYLLFFFLSLFCFRRHTTPPGINKCCLFPFGEDCGVCSHNCACACELWHRIPWSIIIILHSLDPQTHNYVHLCHSKILIPQFVTGNYLLLQIWSLKFEYPSPSPSSNVHHSLFDVHVQTIVHNPNDVASMVGKQTWGWEAFQLGDQRPIIIEDASCERLMLTPYHFPPPLIYSLLFSKY